MNQLIKIYRQSKKNSHRLNKFIIIFFKIILKQPHGTRMTTFQRFFFQSIKHRSVQEFTNFNSF